MIRNSTPTILIIAKINPSLRPTNTVGSAAGSMIFQNICAGVTLNERPTLTSTERVAASPSSVFRITGGSAATNPIITIVTALRPKMTRNNGYMRTTGADANAATHVSHAARISRTR